MHSVNTIMETRSISSILIFIFHSIAADNKALGLEHNNPSSSNIDNKIFVEQNQTFGITCNSNNEIKACSFVTPNNSLLTITHNFNQTWSEGGRILSQLRILILESLLFSWLILMIWGGGNVFYQ